MTGMAENVAAHVAESLADKAMQELKYFCCYKSYVDDFKEEKRSLSARRKTVLKEIQEAKDGNENQIECEVELWLDRANGLIQEVTEGEKKWFDLIPNCFWQYKRGKELEGKTQRIKELIKESKFPRVARSTGLPGIEFYSSANFMQFEDRKLLSEKLQAALKDDKFMIGLYGLGGTGKTTMAIEVGKEVAESKVFDKVIFSVVSKDPNLRNIRDNIAKQLKLDFKEGTEQAQELWKRIAEGGEKVLLILDDVWEELSLQDIGIPLGRRGKSCCSMLLTTRYRQVCIDMGCSEPIELEVLSEKDAVDLFLFYADKSTDSSSNGFNFKDVALDIVKECGRLPVAIVAVARALKSKPPKEWKQCLERLRNPKSIHDVNEDLKQAYNSLKLSYDYLKNEGAKQLFLLCSLFPDDYEIPIELLTRIAMGMKLCGGANKYSVARSYFTPIINVLLDSCLLLKVENENEVVKMHDLVREVALWIGDKQVQVVTDSSTTIMENIQYSSWNINDLPSHSYGRKLEVLLLYISNNADSTNVKVPDGIFEAMENLKFLALMNWSKNIISCVSFFQSLPSLISVRSLAIKGLELGDISILAILKSLESLELSCCSMIELPKEIRELEKLRLLEIVQCHIERNNPFEVFGNCLQLEELYFVSTFMTVDAYESRAQITTFPKLERYWISVFGVNFKVDFSISRYFDLGGFRVKFSDEIFKSLVARAEVLKLCGDYYNRGWTNVVPDILPMTDDSMEDHLIRLCLDSMNGIKCLILTERLRSSVANFSKLVDLNLCRMDVRELCCGPYPVNFLKQLEKLHLSVCKNLEGSLFDGKLELCNLKSIHLSACSMTCLFHPSTAQSLNQLEMLHIDHCSGLKYIVAEPMEDHYPIQKCHDSMFPKLKYLIVRFCHELEFMLPICYCEDLPLLQSMEIVDCERLEYIFGQYSNEGDLHQMGKEDILQSLEKLRISGEVPNFINLYAECYLPCPCSEKVQKSSPSTNVEDCTSILSRGRLCCFWPKPNASTIYHPSASTNHNEAMEMKVNYVVDRTHGLFTPPLYPYTLLRRLEISELVGLKSLFTLSIVSSLKLLEILEIQRCHTLEHIVTDKEDVHDHMNVNSIFPNLREVVVIFCSGLEYLFPAFYSKDFNALESVSIKGAEKLTHVFGKCQADQNRNVYIDLNLPALKRLDLKDIPNIVGICAQNYSMKILYLEDIILDRHPLPPWKTPREALPPFENGEPLHNLQELLEFNEPKNYMSFQNLSKLTITGYKQLRFLFSASTSRRLQKLRTLEVEDCEELVSIIEDQENNKSPMAPHQELFPELRTIKVWDCKSMKYLFSISSGKFPRLLYVNIQDTPQLGEVFRWKHGEGQKLVMENVFPKLCLIRLVNLPTLHTICQGIDFHTVKLRRVRECPAISLTSTDDSEKEPRNSGHEDEDASYLKQIIMLWDLEDQHERRWNASREDYREHKQNRISPKLSEIEAEGSQDIVDDSTEEEGSQQDIGDDLVEGEGSQEDIGNSEEVSKEIAAEDSTTNINLPNLTKRTKTSANEIVEEKLSTTPLSNLDMNLKASFGEGPSSEKYGKPSSSKSHGKESMDDDQQAHGESRSSKEAPQRIEEPTKEWSSKETSNEVSLKIPPPFVTGITSALSTSISSPKKPQIATSTSHMEMESGSSQSDLLTISAITDKSLQAEMERLKPNREGYTEHKQNRISPNLSEIEVEGSQEDIGNDLTMPQQNNGSPHFENSEEVSKKVAGEDSKTNSNLPNLTKSTKTSANKIVEEKLSTTPSSDLDMNLKATFGEDPSLEKCGKASSSKLRGKESMVDDRQAHGESRSSNEATQRIEKPTKEWSSKKTSNEVSLRIPPPSITEMTSALDPSSIITLKKPPTTISTTHTEPKSSQSDMFDISINIECPQVEIMTNDKTCTDEEEMKFDQNSSSQIFEEHDLMRLFQMMKEGADMEVDLSYVSKLIADLHDNKEVAKALADLEASLKKGLNEIACSEESRLRLQNALNMLASHCSEDGASSHGLQDTIQSLQQEIQTVLSSFNQAYGTIDTFTKLEQKEKLMIEQRSQREKDAKTLLYDINTTKNSIVEVQLNEAKLKEQISKLQAELCSKEEEIEEYERKLLSLQEQEKKSVSDTIGFTMEFLAKEKERSRMVEDQMKARQQLKNMDANWSSCLSNLKKTMMLLGVHLKQKL